MSVIVVLRSTRQQLGAWHRAVQIGMYYATQTRLSPGGFRQGGLSTVGTRKTVRQRLRKKKYQWSPLQGKTKNQKLIFKEAGRVLHMVFVVSSDSLKIPAKEMF